MGADSVGQIGLDLVVNQNQFKQQMSGIQSMAKKAGTALAAAFAVKKIWDFGAACVELGSDLSEVQNVVDVTFPAMSKQVDNFAKNAAVQFGLSETMAKKFTGTFGAMAKAFGLPEQAVYEMGTALTGLSGDVASFYNISQDEAYTKLKSVFTGETESLKDLGVVMTQSALDQYALANGFGKTMQAMTEGEKVALRYKFVQEQLSLASGDFIRTSDGWANQIRVLRLQFDSLKATIGQGLINVLTPVIKVINAIIGKLMSLANAFKAFTEMITGKKGSGGGASVAASGMDDVAASADNASSAMGGAGGAAKKAAKDMKTSSTGIDELNIINPETGSDSGGSGGGSGGGGYSADDFDMGQVDTSAMDEMDSKYQGLILKAKELADIFASGFKFGIGDTSVFDSIQKSITGIKESLSDIFTDPAVQSAADNWVKSVTFNLGRVVGAVTSIGATIADNLLGGVDNYLKQNSDRIKEYIVSMFDIGARVAEIYGNFSESAAYIFSAFRSDEAKQITADIIGIFSETFMGVSELCVKFGADILDLITAPIIQNKTLIKTTLEDTFSAVEPIFAEIKSIIEEIFKGLKTTYDTSVGPMFESFKQGFVEITTKLLEAYNTHILPVIQGMSDKFSEFREQCLSPLIDKFLDFAAKVAEAITAIWENCLQPFILWFIENIAPIIAVQLQSAIDTFFLLLAGVSEALGYIFDALGGLMTFITGVFTGDWKKAWEGIKTFFSSIWNAIKDLLFTIWDLICGKVNEALAAVQNTIESAINNISKSWDATWKAVSDFFESIWNSISEFVSQKIDSIHQKILTTTENIRTGLDTALGTIKTKWDETWNGLSASTEKIFDGIWNFIKKTINNIINGVETMANRVIDAINAMIEAVNEVADAIPGVGSDTIPKVPSIHLPRLAQGGFVKANTPQLAMIGDNRHQGEVVAPEDKMQEMVDKAVAMVSGGSSMSDQYLSVMVELLRKIVDLIESMDLTVNIDIREIKQKLIDLDKRTGFSF